MWPYRPHISAICLLLYIIFKLLLLKCGFQPHSRCLFKRRNIGCANITR